MSAPPSPEPLARALGLDAAELDEVAGVMEAQFDALGLDGATVFARLRAGQGIGAALGLPPAAAEVIYARAHRWFLLGRLERAEPLFRALCILEPAVADYWVGHGICLRERRAHRDAAAAFATAERLRPDWAVPPFHAFVLEALRGDWVAAEAAHDRYRARVDATVPIALRQEADRLATALPRHRSER